MKPTRMMDKYIRHTMPMIGSRSESVGFVLHQQLYHVQGNAIFPSNLSFWYPIGGAKLALEKLPDPLSSALPTSMRVTGGSADKIGFWNEGIHCFSMRSHSLELINQ